MIFLYIPFHSYKFASVFPGRESGEVPYKDDQRQSGAVLIVIMQIIQQFRSIK